MSNRDLLHYLQAAANRGQNPCMRPRRGFNPLAQDFRPGGLDRDPWTGGFQPQRSGYVRDLRDFMQGGPMTESFRDAWVDRGPPAHDRFAPPPRLPRW